MSCSVERHSLHLRTRVRLAASTNSGTVGNLEPVVLLFAAPEGLPRLRPAGA